MPDAQPFGFLTVFLIALALSADAFFVALSIATGPRHRFQTPRLALGFGFFQAAMPAIGWVGGRLLAEPLSHVDHWLAFGIVGATGAHMLYEALHPDKEPYAGDRSRGWHLVTLSVATSIDALAMGVVFGVVHQPLLPACATIGIVTAVNTTLAVRLGRRVKARFGFYAEVAGAILLLVIAARMLVTI